MYVYKDIDPNASPVTAILNSPADVLFAKIRILTQLLTNSTPEDAIDQLLLLLGCHWVCRCVVGVTIINKSSFMKWSCWWFYAMLCCFMLLLWTSTDAPHDSNSMCEKIVEFGIYYINMMVMHPPNNTAREASSMPITSCYMSARSLLRSLPCTSKEIDSWRWWAW
jgi:hypothetical protein